MMRVGLGTTVDVDLVILSMCASKTPETGPTSYNLQVQSFINGVLLPVLPCFQMQFQPLQLRSAGTGIPPAIVCVHSDHSAHTWVPTRDNTSVATSTSVRITTKVVTDKHDDGRISD